MVIVAGNLCKKNNGDNNGDNHHSDDEKDDSNDDNDQPGFGTVVALLATTGFALRRQ